MNSCESTAITHKSTRHIHSSISTAIPPYQLNCKRFDIRTRRSVATKAGDCGKKEEKNPGLEPISAYTYKTI